MKKSIRIFQTITFLTLLLTTVFTSCRKVDVQKDDSNLNNNSDQTMKTVVTWRMYVPGNDKGEISLYCPYPDNNCYLPVVIGRRAQSLSQITTAIEVNQVRELIVSKTINIIENELEDDLKEKLISGLYTLDFYEDSDKYLL